MQVKYIVPKILVRYRDKKITDVFYRLVSNPPSGGEGAEMFYQGKFQFRLIKDENNPENDICENDIDTMLTLFSQICYEYECRTLSKHEFAFFDYHINRILIHKQFKEYLFDFAEYCGRHKIGCPYLSLLREGVKVDRAHYERALRAATYGRPTIMNKLKEMLP